MMDVTISARHHFSIENCRQSTVCSQQTVIFVMRTNPRPEETALDFDSHGTMVSSHTNRPKLSNALQMQ